MKLLFTLLIFSFAVSVHAQTRRIAHRFHSGDAHDRYDDNSGNYGIPMPQKVPLHTEILVVVDSSAGDDGKIYYRWDTIDYSSPAKVNNPEHKRIARMRDLGNICTTLTER